MATLAIVNPAAGMGRCAKLAPAALERLRGAGIELEVVHTGAPGEAKRIAADAYVGGVRRFLAVGGDGTAHEILNGAFPPALEQAEPAGGERISLGFLPLGTGNSFLRDFSSRGADGAMEALLSGRKRACDVVRLVHDAGELFYINILSMGFVADVCSAANRRFKRLGQAGYAAAVVLTTAGLKARPLRMRLDRGAWQEQQAIFVSFSNSRFTGGKMMMAPQAQTADGLVDVIVAGAMGRAALLAAFPRIFAGTHMSLPALSGRTARRVEFDCAQALDLMVDGEVVTQRPHMLEVLPCAIEVQV